jgi:hypothetical protein
MMMTKILMTLLLSSFIVGCSQHESIPQGYQVPTNQVQPASVPPPNPVVVQQGSSGTDPLLAGMAGFMLGRTLSGSGGGNNSSNTTTHTTNITRNITVNRTVQVNRTRPTTSRRK